MPCRRRCEWRRVADSYELLQLSFRCTQAGTQCERFVGPGTRCSVAPERRSLRVAGYLRPNNRRVNQKRSLLVVLKQRDPTVRLRTLQLHGIHRVRCICAFPPSHLRVTTSFNELPPNIRETTHSAGPSLVACAHRIRSGPSLVA